MNRDDIITVGDSKQKRTMKWSEFCTKWLRNNKATIKAMEYDLDNDRDAAWYDGVDELTVQKGDRI